MHTLPSIIKVHHFSILANENEKFTSFTRTLYYPIIFHLSSARYRNIVLANERLELRK